MSTSFSLVVPPLVMSTCSKLTGSERKQCSMFSNRRFQLWHARTQTDTSPMNFPATYAWSSSGCWCMHLFAGDCLVSEGTKVSSIHTLNQTESVSSQILPSQLFSFDFGTTDSVCPCLFPVSFSPCWRLDKCTDDKLYAFISCGNSTSKCSKCKI
jgi:hypothetical protein